MVTNLHESDVQTSGTPSAWLVSHARHIKSGGYVLDLACGAGRNARWLAGQGFRVEAVDRDALALASMAQVNNIATFRMDLEANPWPYPTEMFDAIVVCRYLHRPLLMNLATSLKKGGVLIYETFMQGQEQYGRPTNPDFLLKPNELLEVYGQQFQVIGFEQGKSIEFPISVTQKLCAIA